MERVPQTDIGKTDSLTPDTLEHTLRECAASVQGKIFSLLNEDDWNLHEYLSYQALKLHFNPAPGKTYRPKRTREAILQRLFGQTGEFIGMALFREMMKNRNAVDFLVPRYYGDMPLHNGAFFEFDEGYAWHLRWKEYARDGQKIFPGSEYDLVLHQERSDNKSDDIFIVDVTTSGWNLAQKSDFDATFAMAQRKVQSAFALHKILVGLFEEGQHYSVISNQPHVHIVHVPIAEDLQEIFEETHSRMEWAIDMFESKERHLR